MDQGQINGVIFLDLKKAFDTIDHRIQLSKLQAYGIRDHMLKWFQSYLDQRKQICMLRWNDPQIFLKFLKKLKFFVLFYMMPMLSKYFPMLLSP